jgi:hypothetical protein
MQQQQQLASVITALSGVPQAVAVLAPAFIEGSSLDAETRRQTAKDLRKSLGMPDTQDRNAMEQAEQAAEQGQQEQQAMAKQAAEAQVAKTQAEVTKTQSASDLDVARAQEIRKRMSGLVDPETAAEGDEDAQIEAAMAEAM